MEAFGRRLAEDYLRYSSSNHKIAQNSASISWIGLRNGILAPCKDIDSTSGVENESEMPLVRGNFGSMGWVVTSTLLMMISSTAPESRMA